MNTVKWILALATVIGLAVMGTLAFVGIAAFVEWIEQRRENWLQGTREEREQRKARLQ